MKFENHFYAVVGVHKNPFHYITGLSVVFMSGQSISGLIAHKENAGGHLDALRTKLANFKDTFISSIYSTSLFSLFFGSFPWPSATSHRQPAVLL